MLWMGIDIGTLSTRGLLVRDDGRVVGQASIAHGQEMPHPGWVEQDAEAVWWGESVEVIRRLLRSAGPDARQMSGIGVSGLFPALLLAGEDGRPLRPAILYSDTRASEELQAFNRTFGPLAAPESSESPAAGMTTSAYLREDAAAPRLAWLHAHEPDNLRAARFIFSAHNYVAYRLTGTYYLDAKVAGTYGGLIDAQNLRWLDDRTRWAGIDASILPPVRSPLDVVGRVSQEAAALTGLQCGVPVIAGSGDSFMTLLAAGALHPGDALLSFGTTGWLGIITRDLEDYLRNPASAGGTPPYRLEAYLSTLGSLLQWYADRFTRGSAALRSRRRTAGTRPTTYRVLDEEARRIPAGAGGVLTMPYFLPGREDGRGGMDAGAFLGLSLEHTPAHIYRSILESFGYHLRASLEVGGGDGRGGRDGEKVSHIKVTGGGAQSATWRRILSDITGKTLLYLPGVEPCLGNAYLAAYALGEKASLDAVVDWLPEHVQDEPLETDKNAYDAQYRRFLALRGALSRALFEDAES